MQIAVLGTGIVGRTLAGGLTGLGHQVRMGTRDPAETRTRAEFADGDIDLAAYDVAVRDADLVVNATAGQAALAILGSVGADLLDGKVVVDVSNPLDFSQGFPPTLSVKDTDSLAEQIQRAFPQARVVKTLNTVNAAVMVDPGRVGDGGTSVFVAGDDPSARSTVVELLRGLGWQDVIEFEELSAARGMEMWLPLWVRLMGRLGTADFNLKIIR